MFSFYFLDKKSCFDTVCAKRRQTGGKGGDKLSATKKKDALWGNGEKEQLCTISFENCSLKRSKMHVFMFHTVFENHKKKSQLGFQVYFVLLLIQIGI